MAIYEYDCPCCGRFETHQMIGTALGSYDCPECAEPARRIFSAPHLSSVPRSLGTAFDREEKSRDEPDVVTSVPGKRPGPQPHPALARLPRP
jgi:putative FmdB family regulatory protein